MLTVGLFPNSRKQSINPVLGWIIQYFKENGIKVLMPTEVGEELGYSDLTCPIEEIAAKLDIAITLGGDGTVLSTARLVAAAGVPICSINMGRVGFLAEIELPDLKVKLGNLLSQEYYLEERLMIDAFVRRAGTVKQICTALNDVVISKSGFSRMIKLKVFLEAELVADYQADGVIIATSTGSTGYSLSAGGPVVNPALDVMLITPICPHTLYTRSIIVSDREEIRIATFSADRDNILTADGQIYYNLLPEDEIFVRCSPYKAKFIRFNVKYYYKKLRTKLRRSEKDADF